MVNNPEKWIMKHGKKFEYYIVHIETLKNLEKFIKETKKRKKINLKILIY